MEAPTFVNSALISLLQSVMHRDIRLRLRVWPKC